MEPSNNIEKRAAEWLAQRDSGHWTPDDQAALDQWLEASTAHTVAFIRLEAAWNRADRFKALGAGFARGKVPSPEELNLSPFFDETSPKPAVGKAVVRVSRFRAVAASVLLALTAASAWHLWPTGPDYKTPVGGTASVPMVDGSNVTLNTDTAIRVAVTEEEREVHLDRGEAFFEVAKDPNRPFVVSVGKKRVVAVGTKFGVRLVGDEIQVVVIEGTVRVESTSTPLHFARQGAPGSAPQADVQGSNEEGAGSVATQFSLTAGSIARATGEDLLIQTASIPQAEESLSWRTGYLIFRETTLGEAAVDFNRYNLRKIVIADPAVAAIRLSGKFRTTDFDALVRLLEGSFPIHAQYTGHQIILTSSHSM